MIAITCVNTAILTILAYFVSKPEADVIQYVNEASHFDIVHLIWEQLCINFANFISKAGKYRKLKQHRRLEFCTLSIFKIYIARPATLMQGYPQSKCTMIDTTTHYFY